jgi:hypothetical protein
VDDPKYIRADMCTCAHVYTPCILRTAEGGRGRVPTAVVVVRRLSFPVRAPGEQKQSRDEYTTGVSRSTTVAVLLQFCCSSI